MRISKKSPFMRAAAVMAILCMLVACCVCGVVAKYTSATAGSDSITVAEWNFEVNDMNFATNTAQTLTFDLFGTVNEADTSSVESQVSAGVIAPGTGGSFALKIENLSQVDAKYTLTLTETNTSGVYIQYSLDKTTWYDDFTAINADRTDVAIARESGIETVTVYWRWCFEGGNGAHVGQTDVADTALGILAQGTAPSVTIAAKLVATQVD